MQIQNIVPGLDEYSFCVNYEVISLLPAAFVNKLFIFALDPHSIF